MVLARRHKILIFKLSALLSLVRWYNIFFLALSQYLAVLFVLREPRLWRHSLLDLPLHLIVFASLFAVAGGYIINNFYDLEKDLINRPHKTLYEKLVKQSTSLRLYFLFSTISLLLAFSVSFNVLLFFLAFIFALWFYSHKLKKITFIGNLSAALLSITPFFAVFLYYPLQDWLVITYVAFLLLVILVREIVKDLEALKGDVILGYPTLPVRLGINRTKALIALLSLGGLLPAALIFYYSHFSGLSYYLAPGLAGLFFGAGLLAFAEKQEHFARLNHLYRLLIMGGIVSLVLYGL